VAPEQAFALLAPSCESTAPANRPPAARTFLRVRRQLPRLLLSMSQSPCAIAGLHPRRAPALSQLSHATNTCVGYRTDGSHSDVHSTVQRMRKIREGSRQSCRFFWSGQNSRKQCHSPTASRNDCAEWERVKQDRGVHGRARRISANGGLAPPLYGALALWRLVLAASAPTASFSRSFILCTPSAHGRAYRCAGTSSFLRWGCPQSVVRP
jgi:hypothetical protein